ncbi:hypothetical protein HPB52_022993 [Rhipicephalus sanguineus]|uniref:Uncharacterized protein n=1 Tax=Rhipicephalus sanguineus TaxID=34632 RepID=A0A9D4PP33_RHISA|nr:hypothetical protein HPB52_022993 [Rhipicephalus sanguineus]
MARTELRSVTAEYEAAPLLLLAIFDEDQELFCKVVKMIKNFENPVAIFASSEDADLECLPGTRPLQSSLSFPKPETHDLTSATVIIGATRESEVPALKLPEFSSSDSELSLISEEPFFHPHRLSS